MLGGLSGLPTRGSLLSPRFIAAGPGRGEGASLEARRPASPRLAPRGPARPLIVLHPFASTFAPFWPPGPRPCSQGGEPCVMVTAGPPPGWSARFGLSAPPAPPRRAAARHRQALPPDHVPLPDEVPRPDAAQPWLGSPVWVSRVARPARPGHSRARLNSVRLGSACSVQIGGRSRRLGNRAGIPEYGKAWPSRLGELAAAASQGAMPRPCLACGLAARQSAVRARARGLARGTYRVLRSASLSPR